jgi:Fic family protein
MPKLEIKRIGGKNYLYIKDKVKVNGRYVDITIYVGRFENVDESALVKKIDELLSRKLKKYVEYRIKRFKYKYLTENRAKELERLRFYYKYFKEYYPDEVRRYEEIQFVRYVHGTTAIEGNTITLRQVEELFEHGITPAGKTLREIYEVINFKKLRDFLSNYRGDVSERLIKKMHAIIMENILEAPGEYRRILVGIEGSDYMPPPPFEVPELVKELVEWYRKNKRKLHPFELAVLLHTKFVLIHPFVDGNGRVARALMNFVLEKNGYPTLYIGLEHRERYLDAIENAVEDDFKPIVDFMYDIYVEQHQTILQNIEMSLITVAPEKEELLRQFKQMKNKNKITPS